MNKTDNASKPYILEVGEKNKSKLINVSDLGGNAMKKRKIKQEEGVIRMREITLLQKVIMKYHFIR